jgi:hypothetical protein
MTAIRGAAVVLVLVVAVGCGSSSATKQRRDAVNAYFTDVGNAQLTLLSKQGQINSTLKQFSLTRTTALELKRLRNARRDVDDALQHVRALHPPADATKLHALIVERLVLQRSIVDELIGAEVYLPKIAAVSPVLGAAVAALRNDLSEIAKPTGTNTVKPNGAAATLDRYAAAFGGYGDSLAPVSAKLAKLDAPSILRPSLDAEQSGVRRSITLCSAIRSALLKRDIVAANAAIHSLFSVASTLNGPRTRKEQAAAARAYDARLTRINTVATKVDLERARLVRVIG